MVFTRLHILRFFKNEVRVQNCKKIANFKIIWTKNARWMKIQMRHFGWFSNNVKLWYSEFDALTWLDCFSGEEDESRLSIVANQVTEKIESLGQSRSELTLILSPSDHGATYRCRSFASPTMQRHVDSDEKILFNITCKSFSINLLFRKLHRNHFFLITEIIPLTLILERFYFS